MRSTLTKVGFWIDARSPLGGLVNLLVGFPDPRDLVDTKWPLPEREIISAYLAGGEVVERWFGTSYCRFECGERDMGATDLSDGTYLWPEGLAHYVLKHSVRLPEEFLAHIHARARSSHQ